MSHLKKFMFVMAALVAIGVIAASTAKAQVAFQMSSLTRNVRLEGTAEGVGQVTLTSTTAGTIVTNSTISFDYGVDIVSSDNDPDHPDPVAPISTSPGCLFTFEVDGSILTITFTADCIFAVGSTVIVSGLRVNANDAGDGATINSAATATVPAASSATNPITFFIVSSVPVATVRPAFDITIDSGRQVLTCADNPGPVSTDPDDGEAVFVLIEENFNQAFSDDDDEQGYADYGAAGVDIEISTEFTVTFKDVPTDVNIELLEINIDGPGVPDLTIGGIVVGDNFDGDGGDIEFQFTIDATASTGANEEIELVFGATTAEPIDSVSGSVDVNVGVSFAAGDLEDGEVPEFVDNEVEDLGFVVSDCQTRLLFSWVVSNVAGYDTGVAIANTSEDDVAFGASVNQGAIAQAGTCRLTGYPAGGGTPVSFTTPSIAAGRTHAMVMSSTTGFSGFSGYVLAVCNFLNAHAFAFITNGFGSAAGPTLSQGYLANVIPGGTRVNANGEGLND